MKLGKRTGMESSSQPSGENPNNSLPAFQPREWWYKAFLLLGLAALWYSIITALGLPRRCSGKEYTCQYGRHGSDPWVGKVLLRSKGQPTPAFLPGKSKDRGVWRATILGIAESDKTDQLNMHYYSPSTLMHRGRSYHKPKGYLPVPASPQPPEPPPSDTFNPTTSIALQ